MQNFKYTIKSELEQQLGVGNRVADTNMVIDHHHLRLLEGQFLQQPSILVHTAEQALGPCEPLEAPMQAFQQTPGLDLQPTCELATGTAFQSCSCSWH